MTETTRPQDPAVRVREEILAYYAQGKEDGRLRQGSDRLEFWRTQDVLRRLLPTAPARVLDVGGGSGIHAEWLARDGHEVHLLDPVPLHVEQAARLPGVEARVGDARELPGQDASYDVVLLLGPLYHLPERADRVRALSEARRVVRPGGPVVAATINRFAGLHDMLRQELYFTAGHRARVDREREEGRHRLRGRRPLHDRLLRPTARSPRGVHGRGPHRHGPVRPGGRRLADGRHRGLAGRPGPPRGRPRGHPPDRVRADAARHQRPSAHGGAARRLVGRVVLGERSAAGTRHASPPYRSRP